MHILETYALMTGSKIDKCYIEEESIVLPYEQYITFHPYSPKGNSKQYKFWNEVLDLLKADSKFSYRIIQIGEATDEKYNVDTEYLGKTSYNSLAYLIKGSSLHLGFDSLPIHIASHYDVKIVALYSYYASTCGPYFSSESRVRILEPDFSKIKPVFSYDDPFGSINTINPQTVYESVMSLLCSN